jgi:putative redox protein
MFSQGESAMFDVEVQSRASVAPEPRAAHDDQALRVTWQADDRFDIQLREHTITVDQPEVVGGGDVGPTPTELFVAGLASCVAFYARRYLRRHDIGAEGLEVTTTYRMGAQPARVAAVDMEIQLPAELSPNRRAGLLAQATHCTVHNTIMHTPDIAITLVPAS